MALASELLKRLGQMPEQRRSEFLRRLRSAADDGAPLSLRQEQLWNAAVLDPGQSAHGLAFAFRLRGALDVAALAAAIDDVFERHDVLTSVFVDRDGSPVQIAVAHRPYEPRVEDLRHLDDAGRRGQLSAALGRDAREGFDLEQGPMVRLQLFRTADDEHLLLWSTHYMVFDPESAGLVLDALAAAYEARSSGAEPDLPGAMSYGDYARWQRGWTGGEEAQGLLARWRETLAGWQATELPLDRRRPARLDLASAV
ncbi:MAG TPA: condensation domain-containing protein, partial [Candidatus Dormibacteraeota bacterium]